MTHEELRDRLLDLAYGELSPRDAREVEAHAATCEGCRAELARIRGTRQVMSALPVEPAPARGEAVLLAAAREAAERGRERGRIARWLWRGALVAVPVAAVVAVSLRVVSIAPREKPERDALLGEHTFVAPATPAQPPGAAARAQTEGAPAMAAPAQEPAPEAGLARREAERTPSAQRFAAAPPPAPAEKKASAPQREAPPSAGGTAAEANVAPAPRLEAHADAFASAPAAPPPAAAAPSASADLARTRAKAKAAPAPSAGAIAPVSPRQRAIDVATANAARLGYDVQAMSIEAGERPLGEDPARPSDPALAGRTFWTVTFSPRDPDVRGGVLVVFVEDGTFRVLRYGGQR